MSFEPTVEDVIGMLLGDLPSEDQDQEQEQEQEQEPPREPILRAPFPWFGGKSRVAHLVWERFGEVPNYVEPFAGSLAVMLARPSRPRIETVNDLDCYLANFWRALKNDPQGVAEWADDPVNEADLHARHQWLVNREGFRERMKSDPEFYDVKIAGWWVWGICCWIGSGWCAKPEWSGRISACRAEKGVHAKMPVMKRNNGSGVHTNRHIYASDTKGRRPHLSGEVGVNSPADNSKWQKRPELKGGGRGVKRQVPDISGNDSAAGRGVHASAREIEPMRWEIGDGGSVSLRSAGILPWMMALSERLRRVRVCCGDWTRVLGRSPTECIGVTAVFLDPPYGGARDADIYAVDSFEVAHAVRAWAIAHGGNDKLRIALCGYEGEHAMPTGWTCLAWKANGGHGNASKDGRGRENASRERIWFSPHCLAPKQSDLFTL